MVVLIYMNIEFTLNVFVEVHVGNLFDNKQKMADISKMYS